MFRLRFEVTLFGLLLALGGSGAPHAQTTSHPQGGEGIFMEGATDEEAIEAEEKLRDERKKRGERDPISTLPAQYRNLLEQDRMVQAKPRRKLVDKRPVPWLGPDGQQLVGVVGERVLTKPQLKARVDLVLRGLPGAGEMSDEDRRVLTESKLLSDWIDITALALEAQRSGFSVTDDEVSKAMDQLASESNESKAEPSQRLRMIGFPEEQLRQETRDGLLVEKYVRDQVQKLFAEPQLRQIYDKDPTRFSKAPRAHVWQLFRPRVERLSEDEQKELRARFQKLGKKLSKVRNDEQFKALVDEIKAAQPPNDPSNIVLRDLDWISADDPLPEPVLKAIFTTKAGDVTPLTVSRLGIHLVAVREREDGKLASFEEAIPAIQDTLFEKTREGLAVKARESIKVYSSAAGLNKWIPVDKDAAAAQAAGAEKDPAPLPAGQRPTAQNEPDLGALVPTPTPPPAESPSLGTGNTAPAPGGWGNPPPVNDVLLRNAQKRNTK